MNTIQRIIKNTLSLLIGDITANFFGFIAIVYLVRILGPEDFGKISFAMAIVAYFTLITNLGLLLLGTQEIARRKEKIEDYIGSILTLRLSLAILSFCLLLLLTFFLNKPTEIKYLLILYGLALIPYALILEWVFQGMEKMEYIGASRIVASVMPLVLILWFIKGSAQLLLIPCFQVIGNLLAAGLLTYIFVKGFGRLKFRFGWIYWQGLLKQALPIGFAIIMTQIYQGIDIVMLGFMKSNEEVGYYNAAYKIVMVFILLIGAYSNAIYPVISNYYKTSLDSLKKLLGLTDKIMISLALPLAVGGTIIAEPLVHLLYGSGYDNGIIALQILFWVFVIMSMNVARGWGLLGCDRQKQYSMGTAAAVAGNIVLNFMLIPPLGLLGAAIARLLAEGIAFTLYHLEFSRLVKVAFIAHTIKPLFASLVMGSFVYWGLNNLNLNMFVLVLGGLFIYVTLLYLIKGITKEEANLIRNMILAGNLGAG